eukprot:SM000081S22629  [mRNA]  locus=s81:264653:266265:+ [translate_table: standard]
MATSAPPPTAVAATSRSPLQCPSRSVAAVDKGWIGTNAEALFCGATGLPVSVVNDADAAGYAEMGFGVGASHGARGVALMCTFGTGIGTALFVDGILVPNLELGHIEMDGKEAEKVINGVLVRQQGLSWPQWAERAAKYLSTMEALLWPDIIIVGGGISSAFDEWGHLVKLPNGTPMVVAEMKNDAGIVGAAFAALARAAYDQTNEPQQVEKARVA